MVQYGKLSTPGLCFFTADPIAQVAEPMLFKMDWAAWAIRAAIKIQLQD